MGNILILKTNFFYFLLQLKTNIQQYFFYFFLLLIALFLRARRKGNIVLNKKWPENSSVRISWWIL
jgi:hypothetical protein